MPSKNAALRELWRIIHDGDRERFDAACDYVAEIDAADLDAETLDEIADSFGLTAA